VVETVVKAARTGKIGEGKIFILRWKKSCVSKPAKSAQMLSSSDREKKKHGMGKGKTLKLFRSLS
jgi:hypothetical protein